MIRVLIVDDHSGLRRGLRAALARESDIALSEAPGPREALGLVRTQACDLAVLDLGLPGAGGLDLLRDIRRESPLFPVLVLGVDPGEQFGVRALKAGATGCLPAGAGPEDLVKAVRIIFGGGRLAGAGVAEKLTPGLGPTTSDAVAHPHESLSDRELQILRLLGAGKTVREIAAELSLSVPTVSTYRARVTEKLGLRTTAELVRYAVKQGLAR